MRFFNIVLKVTHLKGALFFLSIILGYVANAQYGTDSNRIIYNTQTIMLDNDIRINNELVSKSTLFGMMERYETSDKYYKAYLKAKRPAVVYPLLAFVAIAGGVLLSRENNTAGIVLISSSSIFTITGSIYARKAKSSLNLAIWHYNREVLFPAK